MRFCSMEQLRQFGELPGLAISEQGCVEEGDGDDDAGYLLL